MTEPVPYSTGVDPGWLDFNGHVNDSAYAVLIAAANEELLAAFDLSEDYRRRTGRAIYTAQLTIRYRSEIGAAAIVHVPRTVTRVGKSSLVVTARMLVEDRLCAETEHVYVHVDDDGSRPWSEDQAARLAGWVDREI